MKTGNSLANVLHASWAEGKELLYLRGREWAPSDLDSRAYYLLKDCRDIRFALAICDRIKTSTARGLDHVIREWHKAVEVFNDLCIGLDYVDFGVEVSREPAIGLLLDLVRDAHHRLYWEQVEAEVVVLSWLYHRLFGEVIEEHEPQPK